MRTTLNVDDDVLELAKGLAEARRIPLGKALSDLARRGIKARPASISRSGFHTFTLDQAAPAFGPDEVRRALDAEDLGLAMQFGQRK